MPTVAEYVLLSIVVLSFTNSIHKTDPSLPIAMRLKVTMYSIIGFSILTDLLWILNWESIYGLAQKVVESEHSFRLLSERIYHNAVLISSLLIVVLKAAFMLIVFFSDSDLEKLRSFRQCLDIFTNFITLA